ncbi:hypothetical protein [Algoriphagus sediminis]|uniref:Uncharacterized protein n=1 Tax=Algoriphagus sediminis TaxID=3057113 RepID=A0ABT7YDG3_9BACT|nr:hypothetical protein [Algoriphagus sediminis]MDN3204405.1 hypothetical protein [Algoriphagus sediminis]
MKKLLSTLLILAFVSFSSVAHIGSPGVTLEGKAGPYSVTVVVNSPDVIPGTASVDVYLTESSIDEVQLKPIYWFAGPEGTPKADLALPVPGESGHYKGEIWLMTPGTASIEVTVKGEAGEGAILLPVMAVSTAKKEMDPTLGWTLAGLGAFLVFLMVTIISLSNSDSMVEPGSPSSSKVRRKRWVGAGIGLVVLILILWGGNNWWNSWGNRYERYMYKPFTATSWVETENNLQVLNFSIDSTRLEQLGQTRNINYLIPDHGKIMHMFLLKMGTLDVFAHLHPIRTDSAMFQTVIPPLPAGDYYVFSDVTRLSGFSETIADTLIIPEPSELITSTWNDSLLIDIDDTYYITDPIVKTENKSLLLGGDIVMCGSPGKKTMLPDSSFVTLELPEDGEFKSQQLYQLTFAFEDEEGNPSELEPYLGMMGHSVVFKEEGDVYIHLHPVGTYSMASQEMIESRIKGQSGIINWDEIQNQKEFRDSVDQVIARLNRMPYAERDSLLAIGMDHSVDDPDHPDHAVVKFPYAFPEAGQYRIYVQMKRNKKILNGAFDVEVSE